MDDNRVAEWPFRVFVLASLLLLFAIPLRALIQWANTGDINVWGVFVVDLVGFVLGGIIGGVAWALPGRLVVRRRSLLGQPCNADRLADAIDYVGWTDIANH